MNRPDKRLQTAARLVLGRLPEIRPIIFPRADSPPNFFPRDFYENEGESRWAVNQNVKDGKGGWDEILAMDESDTGYINRLYKEQGRPYLMADLMDTFCRDGLRLCDVLNIMADTCVYLRLVGNRTTARDLITVRQLDRAYMMEHPLLEELGEHPLNDDNREIENINNGHALSPDPEILPELESSNDGDGDDDKE
jgi:hypothetical protein